MDIKISERDQELINFQDMLDYVCRRYYGNGKPEWLHNISSSYQMQI